MKINKILVLFIMLILQGCIGSNRTGYVIPHNWSDRKTIASGGYRAKVSINTSDKVHVDSDDKTLFLELPSRVKDERCAYTSGDYVRYLTTPDYLRGLRGIPPVAEGIINDGHGFNDNPNYWGQLRDGEKK